MNCELRIAHALGSDNLLLISACAISRHSNFYTVGTALIDALLDLVTTTLVHKPRLVIPTTNRNKQHWATLSATRITENDTYSIGWCGPAPLPYPVVGSICHLRRAPDRSAESHPIRP